MEGSHHPPLAGVHHALRVVRLSYQCHKQSTVLVVRGGSRLLLRLLLRLRVRLLLLVVARCRRHLRRCWVQHQLLLRWRRWRRHACCWRRLLAASLRCGAAAAVGRGTPAVAAATVAVTAARGAWRQCWGAAASLLAAWRGWQCELARGPPAASCMLLQVCIVRRYLLRLNVVHFRGAPFAVWVKQQHPFVATDDKPLAARHENDAQHRAVAGVNTLALGA
jgi:hypothetical protein